MKEFDYIVVGAGSAGCVLAARLADRAGTRVLLVEAGGSDTSAMYRKPGMIAFVHQVDQLKAKCDWGFKTVPQRHMNNRKIPYTRGKVLGGCSAVNGMLYLRGNKANYDSWAAAGCEGWSYEEVLPFFKKHEDHQDGASKYHGAGGELRVTRHPDDEISPVSKAFAQAVANHFGISANGDFNGEDQFTAGFYQMTADGGVRHSTSERFLRNGERPNLTVETGCLVERVIIENGRAKGVRVRQNGETKDFYAAAEVILSAGAVGSPHLLMLSGVGPADHLRSHGIDVVVDSAVGQNLHDHLFVPMTFRSKYSNHKGTPFHFLGGMLKEFLVGNSWFGRTVFEAGAFIKTDPSEPIPNMQLHSLPWGYPDPNQDGPGRAKVDTGRCLTVMPTLIYPKSRGTLTLASADPTAAPVIDPNFLAEKEDLELLMNGFRIVREIMKDPAVRDMIEFEIQPGAQHVSDEDLAAQVKLRAMTVYHPVGTCRMGGDDESVVDPQLRVRGVEGLRVADASIMPTVTGGNTNAPSIMIGERAAALI
ncbi:MAG: FAD-binding protein [Myxococcales bacterium]|nr:FAD-binding protein [Myxococcales bacterium]